jgi:hypothetical protein
MGAGGVADFENTEGQNPTVGHDHIPSCLWLHLVLKRGLCIRT